VGLVAAAFGEAGFAAVLRERAVAGAGLVVVPLAPPLAAARVAAFSRSLPPIAVSLAAMAMSRDLRRVALLRCRIPFSAALSRALTAERSSLSSSAVWPETSERRARDTRVRTAERTVRLRMRLRSLARICLRAERELATVAPRRKNCPRAGARRLRRGRGG
jgi:hypothetical protein